MNSLKTKLYQMFILGMEGVELSDNPNLIKALKNGLGGIIFFTQNIESKEQIKHLTDEIKLNCEVAPFLSIDEEGGRVERTENIFNQQSRLGILAQQHKTLNAHSNKFFLSAKFAAKNGENFLTEQTEQIAKLLNELGLNLNFAPVIDVNTNPNNPIIGERAFSDNTDDVIKYGKIVVDTYLKNGIIPCTKHFPGHGDASVDSHVALPKIDLPLDTMEKLHIKPFKDVYSPMVMVAHLHCTAFDKEVNPSSLSKNVINYLKNNLNYQGLIITDDMVMGGVLSKELSPTQVALKAIDAGVNILLYRDSKDETLQMIEEVAKLAAENDDLAKKIEESYAKIVFFKENNAHFFL